MARLRGLVIAGSTGLWLIALWLVSVTMFVLPHGNADQIPFWIFIAVGMAGYATVSLWFAYHPTIWLRRVMRIGSLAAIGFGLYMFVANELQARRTGDFEGYLFLMGLGLVSVGLVNIIYTQQHKVITART